MQYLVLRFGEKPSVGKKTEIDLRLTPSGDRQLNRHYPGGLPAPKSVSSPKKVVVSLDEGMYVIDIDKAVRLLGEEDFKEISLSR